jgi:hypothetical protein
MKKALHFFACTILLGGAATAQNADHLYVNSLQPNYDYKAASFVIDTARPAYPILRGMLMWAANTGPDFTTQALTLDETSDFGVPFTQRINLQTGSILQVLQPKKIIRSFFTKSYYLLAHVENSPNLINGLAVSSSAYVLKLDDNLNLLWSSKIHFNPVTGANAQALIEYNDIMETSDRNVVITGRYRDSDASPQALQLTKLNQNTGLNIWWYWYFLTGYDTNGLSVEEASNRDLVVTGYATQTALNGERELLFARFNSLGAVNLFRVYSYQRGYDVSGGQISRFISAAGADRFFIHGYVVVDGPAGMDDVIHRQHLALDISQNGVINRAVHYGDAGNEETADHIFTLFFAPGNVYVNNITGYTTSYGATRAVYGTLSYNSATQVFALNRYDVIKNIYPGGQVYNQRNGVEIKYAGPGLFALLLNSSLTTANPVPYNHEVTNVFLRNFSTGAADTTCHNVKTPPLTVIKFTPKTPTVTRSVPPYRIYNEKWDISSPINHKLDCGQNWRIYPRQATQVTRRRYTGPGDVVPLRMSEQDAATEVIAESGALFPNPASDEIRFSPDKNFINTALPVTLSLFNASMRLIKKQESTGPGMQRISLTGLPAGLYILEAAQGDYKRTYRFVKK